MSLYIDYNFILSILSIQTNLYRIGGPILIAVGMISNILSLLVFFRKNLRKNPCSIYFIAFNFASLIYIYSSFLSPTLYIGYNISHTAQNLVLCRLQICTAFAFNNLCPFYLILASIDRILITSPNANTRQRSTRRLAYILIGSGAIFWMSLSIPIVRHVNILGSEQEGFYCSIEPGVSTTILSYASLVKEIITPILMIFFGLWPIKNIRRRRHVAFAARPSLPAHRNQLRNEPHSIHAKDRQLILILFIDISIYILFSSFMAVLLMYRYFTQYKIMSLEETVVQTLIFTAAIYSSHVPFCITSYVHLFISKTFRSELKHILLCK